ncbi:MAG: DNA polymerase II [Treponema sp.]|jgi:DNA polymerase-2|nr:DNA polymerase II [Treponema sp.]
MSGPPVFRGLIIHAYADPHRDRLFFTGRLEDGRSFAAVEARWQPYFHIYSHDRERCSSLLASVNYEMRPPLLEAFSGKEPLVLLCFARYGDRSAAVKLLEQAGIPSPDGGMKPPDLFLSERHIRGPVELRGDFRPGRLVNIVFPGPEISGLDMPPRVALRIASIDIETDTRDGSIRAIGIAVTDSLFGSTGGLVRVRRPDLPAETGEPATEHGSAPAGPDRGTEAGQGPATGVVFHSREASLLRAFIGDLQGMDPDVLTGWNFLDFDFPRLAERCEGLGIPFALGRSADEARYFAGEGRRSSAALVPGRQVLDALRIVRAGPRRFPDYTLETVSQAVLGEGKIGVSSKSQSPEKDRIAELDELYGKDPLTFGVYCYNDAELVLRIFAKTGLFQLTVERSRLTGVSLDKAWTSVVSFERIYGMELRRKGIAPPPPTPADTRVSGAAGGTVLDPLPGLFRNVAVFDFRSLYPTIMRTFNIDPLAHARGLPGGWDWAEAAPGQASPSPDSSDSGLIEAPNGAVFSRTPGLLPALIAEYFSSRRKALEAGDEIAAHVYKILMNSFYGVLGTAACRYGRTELAGAITSFARKWLLLSRDWFSQKGCRVLYGDTDSLFVETGFGDEARYEDFLAWGAELAGELNRFLAERIREEYRLESFVELRFEKAYRRFMIPPLRAIHDEGESRGRAKGYGGFLLEAGGAVSVEVKGMEAVRSDVTPLARRLQLELLELVFSGGSEGALRDRVLEVLKQLREGKLDGELVYRKRLSRPPETYTSSTPPQVKAARALGWKGRRGTVEFVWTTAGPEPVSLPHAPLDYDHYTDSQILPLARSIAAAAGWNRELFPQKGLNRQALADGQMELDLEGS